jgi:hypothetical protein
MPLFTVAHVQHLRDGTIAIRCSDFPECEVRAATMQAAREAFSAALSQRVHEMVEGGETPRLHTFEELDYAFSVRCSVEMPAQNRQPGTFDTVIAVRAKLSPATAARLAAKRGDRPRVWRKTAGRIPHRQPLPGRQTGSAETAGGHAAGQELAAQNVSGTMSAGEVAIHARPVGIDPAPAAAAPDRGHGPVPNAAMPNALSQIQPGPSIGAAQNTPQQEPYTLRSALREIESGLKQRRAATVEEMEQRDKLAKANAERLASVRAARQSRQASMEAASSGSAPAARTGAGAKQLSVPTIAEIEGQLEPKRDGDPTENSPLASDSSTDLILTTPMEHSRTDGTPSSPGPSVQHQMPASRLNPSARLAVVAGQLSGRLSGRARFGLLWRGRPTPPRPSEN